MTYEEALDYLNSNLTKLKEINPNSIFIISPFLNKDLIEFIQGINDKGLNNIDVKNYSSDSRFGVYAFDYRAL